MNPPKIIPLTTNAIKTFFSKKLLFSLFVLKNIVSLHPIEKSSGFAIQFLTLEPEKFQKELQEKIRFRKNADLFVCNSGDSQDLSGKSKSAILLKRDMFVSSKSKNK